MFSRFFKKDKKLNKDIKVLSFIKFANSIGAYSSIEDDLIDLQGLLEASQGFLVEQRVVTKKQEEELLIFQEKYNRFLEYCLKKKYIKKDQYIPILQLHLTKVPDMSQIEIPDIKDELKAMDIDLEKLGEVFSKIKLQ